MNILTPLVGLSNCKECPLYEDANNVVEGVGPIPTHIMLVGEAPGALEDEIGDCLLYTSDAADE